MNKIPAIADIPICFENKLKIIHNVIDVLVFVAYLVVH